MKGIRLLLVLREREVLCCKVFRRVALDATCRGIIAA